jgi:hypothetical protein
MSLTKGRHADRGFNGEHIIPQSLFGEQPPENTWRPILNVHVRCHNEIKNEQGEQTAILLHKLHTLDGNLADRNWAGNLKSLGLVLRQEYDPKLGQTLFMVKGFGEAHKAVWNWVRGLHAFTYQQYLPAPMKHKTFAPMPEMFIPEPSDTRRQRIGPEKFDADKRKIGDVLKDAWQQGQFDGVRCWDGRCQYMCVWANRKRGRPFCMWTLLYDKVTDYAKGAPFPGTPWMGMYTCVKPPENRTVLATI